jgi:hypothetical protein
MTARRSLMLVRRTSDALRARTRWRSPIGRQKWRGSGEGGEMCALKGFVPVRNQSAGPRSAQSRLASQV